MGGSWSNTASNLIILVEQISGYSGLFAYSPAPGTGNLVLSITALAGTDPYGNVYQAGLTTYSTEGTINLLDTVATFLDTVNGSEIDIEVGGGAATLAFTPPAAAGVAWQQAGIGAFNTNVFGPNTAELSISAPYNRAHVSRPSIEMFGSSDTSSNNRIDLTTQLARVTGDLTAGSIDSGTFSITPTVASQWTANTAVSFSKTFSSPPVVMVTPSGNGPGVGTATDLEWQTTNVTTTGFQCRILRGNLTLTTLSYLAVYTG
ncbi:MAG: H-type lectin domain-containing protein [Catenulispora sp.]